MKGDDTISGLLATGRQAGIHKFLVNSVATSPAQVYRINDFIAQAVSENSEFIGFAALHQDMPDVEREVDRVEKLGLRGVKLHPDIQRFQVDDRRLDKLYASLEGRLPLLVHTGDYRYDFSGPARIAAVLDRFPKLDVICAHFGGYTEWDIAAHYLAGRRLWVDTSSSLAFLSPERARCLIDAFGSDRVLFGTDYPMWDAPEELARLDKLNLPEEVREKILYKNICALLDMTINMI